jgi:hypothetical protein
MTLVAQVIAGYSLLQILIFVVIIAVVISIAHAILGRSCTAVLVLLLCVVLAILFLTGRWPAQ